jgi:hypothetical protein
MKTTPRIECCWGDDFLIRAQYCLLASKFNNRTMSRNEYYRDGSITERCPGTNTIGMLDLGIVPLLFVSYIVAFYKGVPNCIHDLGRSLGGSAAE